jgi:hypothetical protein
VSECFVYPKTRVEKRARIAEEANCTNCITIHTTTGIDVKVQIKWELKRNLIFGIQSRPAIGMILSFFGFSHEVFELMQTLSHSTRAFIYNAERLNGFLVKLDICQILHDAYESGELKQAIKHQYFNLLCVQTVIFKKRNTNQALNYLSETYPHLYRCVLVNSRQTEKLK